jgi:hypothetical protein
MMQFVVGESEAPHRRNKGSDLDHGFFHVAP